MSTNETPEVVIEIEADPETPEPVEDNTTVIVADAPASSDAVEAVTVAAAIDQAGRIAELEAELNTLRSEVYVAQDTAATAEFLAEVALDEAAELAVADEEIIEATDEAIIETVEGAEIDEGNPLTDEDDEITTDEIAPVSARVHPLFRTLDDWKGGK